MNDFDRLARQFAATGELTDDEMRRLHAAASFTPADTGTAESIGLAGGGSEIALARVIANEIAERRKFEATICGAISGETRPADVPAFCWSVSRLRGRPPQPIADGLGVLRDWSLVADALERRLCPPKPAPRGGEIHEVAR